MRGGQTCIVLMCICGCGLAQSSTASAGEVDLIIVAGQSNAVGFDTNSEKLRADSSDKKVLFWWRCGDAVPDEHDSTLRQPGRHSGPAHANGAHFSTEGTLEVGGRFTEALMKSQKDRSAK